MIIQCFDNPWMTDFIYVCAHMPQDERQQLEQFTGEEYNVDRAAVGNFTVPGPKWVIKVADDEDAMRAGLSTPLVVGGFVPQRTGVYRDWLLTTPLAWGAYGYQVTRICRRIMDAMLIQCAHRLECIVPAPRVESRPELVKWYKVLGYNQEGRHYGYCANGADAISFSRVKHGLKQLSS